MAADASRLEETARSLYDAFRIGHIVLDDMAREAEPDVAARVPRAVIPTWDELPSTYADIWRAVATRALSLGLETTEV